MKKTGRMIISILMVLLMLTSLPISAMAVADNPADTTFDKVPKNETMQTNDGTIKENKGTVVTNNGQVGTFHEEVDPETGTPTRVADSDKGNFGTIKTNEKDGVVTINQDGGTIDTNYGAVITNMENGTVTKNSGVIQKNDGKVVEGKSTGTIVDNSGSVDDNAGLIVDNNGAVDDNTGRVARNFGSVDTNGVKPAEGQPVNWSSGAVHENKAVKNADGTYVSQTGVVNNNYGVINANGEGQGGKDSGTVTNNYGLIDLNFGTVAENQGIINGTDSGSFVQTNGENGQIDVNRGAVDTNEGEIRVNADGTVGTNNGIIKINTGSVTENNGTIADNCGKIATNNISGVVLNADGSVDTNYGTVVDADGTTYYGVDVRGSGEGPYQKEAGETLNWNLAKLFKRTDYKLTGYQDSDGNTVKSTEFTYSEDAPTWLKLIWKFIGKPASSDEPVQTASATYIPGKLEGGTEFRIRSQRFQVLEAKDGTLFVATVGWLSQKDMADMMTFLAKYFTPEQLEKLVGAPELLSPELAEQYFGAQGDHISFRIPADLL